MANQLISIIIPVYNEAPNVPLIYQQIAKYIDSLTYQFELIFIDDGSRDDSTNAVRMLRDMDRRVRLIEFARNFGKEAAISAGLHASKGAAAIMIDADLQHPPKLIPKFIHMWVKGADVVVGVRDYDKSEGWLKTLGSKLFYKIMNRISSVEITPHATDYRLLDRQVITAFNKMRERNRMTRGLIDWLGYHREFLHFQTGPRLHGERSYTLRKLLGLAINSFTSHSLLPLKAAGYLGWFILISSGLLSVVVFGSKYVLRQEWAQSISGAAQLAVITLFLVGLILVCFGLVSMYIAHIHAEVTNRPLYIVREERYTDENYSQEKAAETLAADLERLGVEFEEEPEVA